MTGHTESSGSPSSGVDEVDYILVSNQTLNESETARRQYFETGLKHKGLHVDHEEIEDRIFTKLSLPDEVKYKYFEILELRMPLKMESQSPVTDIPQFTPEDVKEMGILDKMKKCSLIDLIQNVAKSIKNYYLREDEDLAQIKQDRFFAPFKEKQRELFDLDSASAKKKIWNILIINFILSRQRGQKQGDDPFEKFTGIEALINKKIFTDAYPLHDGDFRDEGTKRNDLYKAWNTLFFWKNLPLDDLRDYLGNTCAIYFAWLEFYKKMLFTASFFGILLIVYGFITLQSNNYSDAVCKATNISLCPACEYNCSYYPLNDNCVYAKVAQLFDNDFAIVYSTLMALWASVLIGLWKRRNKVLQHKWNLLDSVDEKSRVQYIAKLEKYQEVTGKHVKKLPVSLKKIARIKSRAIMLFFILLIVIANIAILVYEICITGVIASLQKIKWLANHSSFIIFFTTSLLNLIAISALNKIYSKVAVYTTDKEFHRTKSEYDRALTVKNFAFQFINTYATVLYIALIKDKFSGYPGHYVTIFGYRQIECNHGSCLMELNIQLATIMVGQQIIESFGKLGTTFVRARYKLFFSKKETEENDHLSANNQRDLGNKYTYRVAEITSSRWEEDYDLLDYETDGALFNEYLELAIQYGFVILFTPAFPLAPLFAWIRNIFEIRFDATKIIALYRRLVPFRNPNITIWMEICAFMGSIAVLINAIVIAFSTKIINRHIYSWYHNGTEEGYLYASFSEYKDEKNGTCFYADFRQPYSSHHPYEPTSLYWHILMAKFVFIIVYQNVIFIFKNLILNWIPETPGQLRQFQKKERDFFLSSLEPPDPEESEHRSRPSSDIKNTEVPQPRNEQNMQTQLEEVTTIGINRLQLFKINEISKGVP